MRAASRAVAEVAKSDQIERLIVTSRITNYESLIHASDVDLSEQGFRVAIIYGQSPAAIEKRVFMLEKDRHRDEFVKLLSESKSRSLWLQVFRLPLHFDFVAEFLIESDINNLELTRASVIEKFVEDRLKEVAQEENLEWSMLDDVNQLLTDVGYHVFREHKANEQFRESDVWQAIELRTHKTPSAADKQRLSQLLHLAVKLSVVVQKKDGVRYEFRHAQFMEYYAAKSPLMWEDLGSIEFANADMESILKFKVSQRDRGAKQVLEKLLETTNKLVDNPEAEERNILIRLAVACIENSEFAEEEPFQSALEHLREKLRG
jgi:hypothetical protein